MDKKEEELSFDFSKITDFFKKKPEKHKETEKEESEENKERSEELAFEPKQILDFFIKYKVVFLILIPIFLSIFLRIQPAYLPVTDDWAENSVNNYFKNQITDQVNQQYPNLPPKNKNVLIANELEKLITQQKDAYDQQVTQLSQHFKSQMQDDKGQTYLIAIDPYFYYRQSKNLVNHGHVGDSLKDGRPWNDHTLAPIGEGVKSSLHHHVIVWTYKIMHIFNSNVSLMAGAFFVPLIIATLAVIPAFFIGRRIKGPLAGLFAAVIVAAHPVFITRTVAGFSDTDAYNVTLPLFVFWIFLEAFYEKDKTKKMIYAGLSAVSLGIFSFAWDGWWYIFDFVLFSIIAYIIYLIIFEFISNKKDLAKLFKDDNLKNILLMTAVFIVLSGIFITIIKGWTAFVRAPLQPLSFLTIKEAAKISLWPNVYTTVAEMGDANIRTIINNLGGKLFFFLGIIGLAISVGIKKKNLIFVSGAAIWSLLLLVFLKNIQNIFVFAFLIGLPVLVGFIMSINKKEKIDALPAIVLTIWFMGMMYASTQGMRFVMILMPAYAIAFGITAGYIYDNFSNWLSKELNINKNITKPVIMILLLLLLIPTIKAGYETSTKEVPSMNDGWYGALTKIKENSQPDAIINSWWDFGHWFKVIADRAVTFDGASQNNPQAHWVGKVLLTSDEQQAIAILRMLDCGANNAFDILNEEIDDPVKSIKIMYKTIELDGKEAEEYLTKYISDNKAQEIVKNMYCEPPEDFFITSEDMVGKSGVWAHFGSWNFERADIWRNIKNKNQEQGVSYLKKRFNYSDDKAKNTYNEVLSLADDKEANSWISPWPSYISGVSGCRKTGNSTVECSINIQGQVINILFDVENWEANVQGSTKAHPKSFSYIDENGKFKIKEYEENTLDYSVSLIYKDNQYSATMMYPELVGSMFNRLFYYDGEGLKHFDFFDYRRDITGLDIYTWKVDWEGIEEVELEEEEENIIAEEVEEPEIEE